MAQEKGETSLLCLLLWSLVGYEPKTTRVLLSEMEQREAQETVGEGKSADEQLKAMMEATESSGLEPRPA